MPTRSMKKRVLMQNSPESAKEADYIRLIKGFLIHLGTRRIKNRKHEMNIYLPPSKGYKKYI